MEVLGLGLEEGLGWNMGIEDMEHRLGFWF